MVAQTLISLLVSFGINFLIVKYKHIHIEYSRDHTHGEPQKIHDTEVSRIGGIGIFGGMLTTFTALYWCGEIEAANRFYFGMLLCALPAFCFGIFEDIFHVVSPRLRLLATSFGGVLGFFLLGSKITYTAFVPLDFLLGYLPISLAFTAFAVSGASNAINIIDGLNGLASMVSMLCLVVCAYVGYINGDWLIVNWCGITIGAILGFFFWNFPRGHIFLGDGGAYLLGFIVAEIVILLVVRHKNISPFFPILLLQYPVIETLFSIFRRKYLKKGRATKADALHLHTLLYRRSGGKYKKDQVKFNSKLSMFIWGFVLISVVSAGIFYEHTMLLIVLFSFFSIIYLWIYQQTIRFKLFE